MKTKKQRNLTDHYATQPWIAAWAVDKAMELLKQHKGETDPEKMTMLEPGCGLNAPFSKRSAALGIDSYGLDIMTLGRPFDTQNTVVSYPHPKMNFYGNVDFLDCTQYPLDPGHRFDIIATNPPFNTGWDFVGDALDLLKPKGILAILQKLSFVATPDRFARMMENTPIEQCPMATKRLSFTDDGKTDTQEYCIFFWGSEEISEKIRRRNGRKWLTSPQDNKSWIERWNNGWDS